MKKRVEVKRTQFTICTYKSLVDKFREQSFKMNKSMSRRVEEFIINELEKEKKNEN